MGKQILIRFSDKLQFETIELLVQQAKEKLNAIEIKTIIKKKIINILIECLENIYKYSEPEHEKNNLINKYTTKIILEKDDDYFTIIAGNLVLTENVEKLKERIEKVNSMNREDLQKSYEQIINNNEISDKGGAGLGFIDISLKSDNKIFYDFKKVNEKYSFFEIHVKINN